MPLPVGLYEQIPHDKYKWMSFEEMQEMHAKYMELEHRMWVLHAQPWALEKIQEELYYIKHGKYPD